MGTGIFMIYMREREQSISVVEIKGSVQLDWQTSGEVWRTEWSKPCDNNKKDMNIIFYLSNVDRSFF